MNTMALVVSLLLAALALLAVVFPQRLTEFARSLLTPAGMCTTAVGRLGLGIIFVVAAADSRLPWTVQSVGVISMLGGVIAPMFGLDRHQRILEWWTAQGLVFMRAWSALALALSIVLVYAFLR